MDSERNKPLVSIILPVYNTAEYLKECIESILSQSFADFELIIVDDASHDGSVHIIEHYSTSDHRIRFVRNSTNRWIGFTRNRGLALALGAYIANFDSDDIAFPEWIETQLLFLENNPDIDIVGVNLVFINRSGKKLFEKNHFPQYDRDIKKMIPLVCPIANNTVLIRKNVSMNCECIALPHMSQKITTFGCGFGKDTCFIIPRNASYTTVFMGKIVSYGNVGVLWRKQWLIFEARQKSYSRPRIQSSDS